VCRRTFSQATGSETFGQKKRRLNAPVWKLLCSGVSQRRIALLLGTNPKTVARKLVFHAARSRAEHEAELKERAISTARRIKKFQFDELETFERSKLLPVSVPLAVCAKTRRILGFQVASMPAKGLLVEASLKKYGKRPDDRKGAIERLLNSLVPISDEAGCELLSDQCPRYPSAVSQAFQARGVHKTVKGRRGCVVGQGELKKVGRDPLFSLNHTCAMLRANLNRLFRRTWCTTKRIDRLEAHLWIYVRFHNEVLLKWPPEKRGEAFAM
jgi:hypothetical protein